MAGFNKPNTTFRTRMIYHEFIKVVNQRKVYDPIPKSFYGSYSTDTAIDNVGATQGLVSTNGTISTNTNMVLKIGSKILVNGFEFNLESEIFSPNTQSTSSFLNKPTVYTRFLQVSG